MSSKQWFSETLHGGVRVSYEAERILYQEKTGHQELVLIENEIFGKVLLLDGVVQVTSKDEFIYHEMMSHVPMLAHGNAKEILIVGGGDCGLAEEVLKHQSVNRLTQVEIDEAVVAFSRQHFSEFNEPVFSDERFDLVIDDGMRFVEQTERRFDIIIVDSTDPIGPGAVLFSPEFYSAANSCLNPGGILITQNGVPFLQAGELGQSTGHRSQIFSQVTAYVISVPTYFGGHMTLGWATDDPEHRETDITTLRDRFAATQIKTRYYTPEVHLAAFALPRYILDILESTD
ncbi:MAG: polyamine aminopropyltransferase [Stappiaceae bacterium]